MTNQLWSNQPFHRLPIILFATGISWLLTSCELWDTGCSSAANVRFNFCLTVSGSTDLPDSLLYIREMQNGFRDTLQWPSSRCFSEKKGGQRVLVYDNDSVVFATEWVTLKSEDCGHVEGRTLDIPL